MRGKEKKKGREKAEKKKKKRRGKFGIISHKKKISRRIWGQSEIRNFGKSNLDLLSFSWKIISMSELGDIQGLNIHPTPILATGPKLSGSPKVMPPMT